MLGKLMKYDLKKMYKVLVALYIVSIALALVCRGVGELGKNIFAFKVIYIIFSSIEYAIIANVVIHCFIRILLRFNNNFYKDESYLTHTLPVSKSQLLLSKYLSALIVIFSSVAVAFASLFIMFFSKDLVKVISDFLLSLSGGLNLSVGGFVTLFVLVLFSQICSIMSMSFFSIILGNKANEKKEIKSLIWFAILYVASLLCTLLSVTIVCSIFGVVNEIFSNVISQKTLLIVFVLAIILYTVYSVVFYLLCNNFYKKGVNVD